MHCVLQVEQILASQFQRFQQQCLAQMDHLQRGWTINHSKKTVIQLTNSAWMMCYTLAGILAHGLTLAQCNPTIKLVQHSWIPKQVTQLHKGQNNPLNHISMETQETF